MKSVRSILAVFAALSLAACQPSGGSAGGVDAPLDEPFELAFGQTARVDEAGLNIRFVDVTEDSRCPTNAECIWAGQAVMVFEATPDGGPAESITVTLEGDASQPVQVGGYTVTVSGLSPYPGPGPAIEKENYIATVTVAAAP